MKPAVILKVSDNTEWIERKWNSEKVQGCLTALHEYLKRSPRLVRQLLAELLAVAGSHWLHRRPLSDAERLPLTRALPRLHDNFAKPTVILHNDAV